MPRTINVPEIEVARRGSFPAGSAASNDLILAKRLLVSLHGSSCDQHWGPCECLLAQAIRSLDTLQGLEAGCEWQVPGTVAARSFWAKTAKGRH